MNKFFSFLKKQQFGLFFVVVSVVCTFAFVWLCKINYMTTFNQLGARMPKEAATAFTLVVQGFEFLIPVITLLGIMKALEISKTMRVVLYVSWVVIMAVDFLTAYAYFIGYYTAPIWYDMILSLALSMVFLFAEVFVVLSVISLVVSINFWRKGNMPAWITRASTMPMIDHSEVLSEDSSKTETPAQGSPVKKVFRETRGGRKFCLLENGVKEWLTSGFLAGLLLHSLHFGSVLKFFKDFFPVKKSF